MGRAAQPTSNPTPQNTCPNQTVSMGTSGAGSFSRLWCSGTCHRLLTWRLSPASSCECHGAWKVLLGFPLDEVLEEIGPPQKATQSAPGPGFGLRPFTPRDSPSP